MSFKISLALTAMRPLNTLGILALIVVLLNQRANAEVLLNENFNELTPGPAVSLAGEFQAVSGNVDILGPGYFPNLCVAPTLGNCIDLDGGTQGTLQSSSAFTLQPGENYYLSFDLIGSQRGVTTSTTISFGDYSHTFNLSSGDNTSGLISNQLIQVNAPTISHLTFASNTPGDEGAIIDNVLITSVPSVPEPSTWAMILFGVAGLGYAHLRSSRRARPYWLAAAGLKLEVAGPRVRHGC